MAYLAEEQNATGTLPTDQTLVVQRFRDEIGDWRVVLLSPFGAQIHAPWGMATTQMLRTRHDIDVDVIWADDGIAFRFPDADAAPDVADLSVDPDEVEDLVVDPPAARGLEQGVVEEEAESTARPDDPGHLGDRFVDGIDVLEHEAGDGGIEAGVCER